MPPKLRTATKKASQGQTAIQTRHQQVRDTLTIPQLRGAIQFHRGNTKGNKPELIDEYINLESQGLVMNPAVPGGPLPQGTAGPSGQGQPQPAQGQPQPAHGQPPGQSTAPTTGGSGGNGRTTGQTTGGGSGAGPSGQGAGGPGAGGPGAGGPGAGGQDTGGQDGDTGAGSQSGTLPATPEPTGDGPGGGPPEPPGGPGWDFGYFLPWPTQWWSWKTPIYGFLFVVLASLIARTAERHPPPKPILTRWVFNTAHPYHITNDLRLLHDYHKTDDLRIQHSVRPISPLTTRKNGCEGKGNVILVPQSTHLYNPISEYEADREEETLRVKDVIYCRKSKVNVLSVALLENASVPMKWHAPGQSHEDGEGGMAIDLGGENDIRAVNIGNDEYWLNAFAHLPYGHVWERYMFAFAVLFRQTKIESKRAIWVDGKKQKIWEYVEPPDFVPQAIEEEEQAVLPLDGDLLGLGPLETGPVETGFA